MDYASFTRSLTDDDAPVAASDYLRALWHDARGDWDRAHDIVQDINTSHAAQIHAYLHRKEGDISNADYWYRRAGTNRPESTLDEEWDALVRNHL